MEVTMSQISSPPKTRAGGQGHSKSGAVFKQAEMGCSCFCFTALSSLSLCLSCKSKSNKSLGKEDSSVHLMKIQNPAQAVINLQAQSFKELMHRRVKVLPSLMCTNRCELLILWV